MCGRKPNANKFSPPVVNDGLLLNVAIPLCYTAHQPVIATPLTELGCMYRSNHGCCFRALDDRLRYSFYSPRRRREPMLSFLNSWRPL